MSKNSRSPNYPYIDFPEAIQKTKAIFDVEKTNPASREVLAKSMGYSGITGSSAKVIAALSSYGLIDGRGDDYKISKAGIDILLAEKNSSERKTALLNCAFAPALFGKLKERFGSDYTNLPSDESFKHYLVSQNNFTIEGATSVASSYRKTVGFISSEIGHMNDNQQDEEPEADDNTENSSKDNKSPEQKQNLSLNKKAEIESGETFKFRITKDCQVKIFFDGEVTPAAIDKLIKHLELTKDAYEIEEAS